MPAILLGIAAICALAATILYAKATLQPPHDLGHQRADVDWHVATVRGVSHGKGF